MFTIGASLGQGAPDSLKDYPKRYLSLSKRTPKVLSADKLYGRDGQWTDRFEVAQQCLFRRNLCDALNEGLVGLILDRAYWLREVSQYQFVLCVHGGGVDPSPKAWEAVRVGTVPIVERSALVDAYAQLPIVFVDSIRAMMTWSNLSVQLQLWANQYSPYYEHNSALRNQTMQRLKTVYWYRIIAGKMPPYSRKDTTRYRRRRKSHLTSH